MSEIALRSRGPSPALALLAERRLVEYWPLDEDLSLMAGAIYQGRAGRVMKSLGALFVTLAPGIEGFLPFDELAGAARPAPGDSLLVQIKKPAQGSKAAYLTCDVTLPGRYAMLLPRGSAAHASKRVQDRQALRALARRLCPDGCGLVLRANAEDVDKGLIQSEIASLQAQWQALVAEAQTGSAPRLLQGAPDALTRLLTDERQLPKRILTDEAKAAQGYGLPIQEFEDPFSLYSVEQQLHRALRRRVYLPSGGLLVLDPCEAALLIDVNTAQDNAKGGDLILRTNVEAAAEIARLLRLRRVGGIILIDFIDMETDAQRAVVQSALEEALLCDRVMSEVLGFTRLGLLEMTRKKAQTPLPAQRFDGQELKEDDNPEHT